MKRHALILFALVVVGVLTIIFGLLAPIPLIARLFGLSPEVNSSTLVERQTFASALSAAASVATLIAAVWAGLYATMAVRAARQQIDATRRVSIEEQRPWISVDLLFAGEPSILRDKTWEASIGIHIKNLGRSPALNVQTSVTTIDFEMDLHRRTRAFAEEHRKIIEEHGRPLLPGEEYVRPWGATVSSSSEFGPTPVIMGCVTYQSSLDMSVHQTAFCFVVDTDTPYGEHVASLTSRLKKRSKIELSSYWGAGFAD